MPQGEANLMLEIFGKIVSEKKLDNYLAMEDEMREQETETQRDIAMGLY